MVNDIRAKAEYSQGHELKKRNAYMVEPTQLDKIEARLLSLDEKIGDIFARMVVLNRRMEIYLDPNGNR
jgi:hypothetical protein